MSSATNSPKTLAFIQRNDTRFSVGSFSPVLSVFSYHDLGTTVSPFLLLDHIGPSRLVPSPRTKGVNEHPHRGFETVTLVYQGELQHKDSTGSGGTIGAGDVQWMTAGSGIVHQEQFSQAFSERGGPFEIVQLWVNLPAKHKMTAPRYQSLTAEQFPIIALSENSHIRVIAGEFKNLKGPAQTFSPMTVLDGALNTNEIISIACHDGDTALIYVLQGEIAVDATEAIPDQALAVLSSRGNCVDIKANERSRILVLIGKPLGEPINGHGPFVMNTYEEIIEAYDDIKSGRFGQTTPQDISQ